MPSIENLVALFGALGIIVGLDQKEDMGSLDAGIVSLYETRHRSG